MILFGTYMHAIVLQKRKNILEGEVIEIDHQVGKPFDCVSITITVCCCKDRPVFNLFIEILNLVTSYMKLSQPKANYLLSQKVAHL